MPDKTQMLYAIEVHSVEGINKYFADGGSPNDILPDGVPLFTMMIEMYTRGPRFRECIRAFIDAGLEFEDKALLAVLAHNATKLEELLKTDTAIIQKTYTLYNNTYTPLTGGTLMHFCAEYNSVDCAGLLLKYGADIDAKAATDEYGFGGHTPVFHTVNQNSNSSADMLYFLLENRADLTLTVKGLIWGKGYEWETFVPAVNPISYAMMGLLPQFHRGEKTIAETVSLLIKHVYGIDYMPPNIPNAYLARN
ncbi:ankyrin repeat domain-containing protein [Mucilaginibacter sp. L3T2-6]|uniref:ankyrin repeat domain-containing protein n=1 Tax=Mucilaginibacter sp. L3T2-6 TaxID=3062491 RepID=UPI002675D734|nr:ankyrin repeat domain-containing protein [Mucilaginibacter sp. L3T2-6]MDO3642572.1 ankyrin repeat domain-containing protein [Mucilaginibacter sp. L3T2-6]MDV6215032.1 ankyrin repeat domain-containing protein [Mucilaginibacter sp. L3T2-6]